MRNNAESLSVLPVGFGDIDKDGDLDAVLGNFSGLPLLFARLLPNAELLLTDSSNHILLPQEPAFERLMTALDAFLA